MHIKDVQGAELYAPALDAGGSLIEVGDLVRLDILHPEWPSPVQMVNSIGRSSASYCVLSGGRAFYCSSLRIVEEQ